MKAIILPAELHIIQVRKSCMKDPALKIRNPFILKIQNPHGNDHRGQH